nr:hypothetical protein [Tanacetum cinerariifolium]
MLVPRQAADDVDDVVADNVPADDVVDVVADDVITNVVAHVAVEPNPPSPIPTTTPPSPQQDVTSTPPTSPHQSLVALSSSPPQQLQPSQITTISMELLNNLLETLVTAAVATTITTAPITVATITAVLSAARRRKGGRLEESQAKVYHIDLEHADKVLSMQDNKPEPAELKEVIEVVTTAKLMTEVVTAAVATTITTAPITAATITAVLSAARRRKGVVIRDPEETATTSTIVHSEPKSKDKGKGIVYFNFIVAFLEKSKEELEEEESIALKRKTKSSEEKAVKKQKLDEEVEELKKHLQIVPNNKDNVYTEATPLTLKVPVIDYEIHTENNKPYYKIIKADGSHQLFLSFISLLRNFDREYLEMLWQIVKERFASSNPRVSHMIFC